MGRGQASTCWGMAGGQERMWAYWVLSGRAAAEGAGAGGGPEQSLDAYLDLALAQGGGGLDIERGNCLDFGHRLVWAQ